MTGGLGGAHAKLDRAEKHLGELEAAISWWRKQDPYTIAGHHSPDKTEHRFLVTINVEPDLVRWGLIAGDCIHNLRSALDHVAWQAALVHGEPPKRTEFPIFTDKALYLRPENDRSGGLHKISGIKDPSVRALIEDAQPWKRRPEGPDQDHLAVLHEFDRQDKHRVLTPVLVVPRGLGFDGTIEFGDEQAATDAGAPLIHVNTDPVEDGAELLALHTAVPAARVKMKFDVALAVGIKSVDTIGGLTGTLGELCKHTRRVVETVGDRLV